MAIPPGQFLPGTITCRRITPEYSPQTIAAHEIPLNTNPPGLSPRDSYPWIIPMDNYPQKIAPINYLIIYLFFA